MVCFSRPIFVQNSSNSTQMAEEDLQFMKLKELAKKWFYGFCVISKMSKKSALFHHFQKYGNNCVKLSHKLIDCFGFSSAFFGSPNWIYCPHKCSFFKFLVISPWVSQETCCHEGLKCFPICRLPYSYQLHIFS